MARLIVSALLVAVAFAAAVEGRNVQPVVTPIGGTNPINASVSNFWINRKLLGDRKLTGEDECQHICDQVKFRTMCRSLTRLPRVSTPRDLLEAAVRVATSKAQMAKRRVDDYAAAYHGGNPMASMLQTCSEAYDRVAQSLALTQHLIDGHATNAELNRQISDVTTSAQDCNNAFEERPEIESPFPGTMRNVYRVTDNVLNIAYAIKQV